MTLRKFALSLILTVSSIYIAFSADGYFIGDGAAGKRILMDSSTIENGKASDEWLAAKVKRDLIDDLVNYSNMDIIDSDEKATIRKLQKDSLSGIYSESDPIELGKTIQAKSYIRMVTTRKKNTYSFSATITNIETSRTEGSYKSPFYSESDFIAKAHGEAAIQLLEALGVRLTAAGKRLLQYNTFNITESESRENLEAYEAELARLEKEQQELKTTRISQIDADALNTRIEVQKATLLQQQKNEEERLARLNEDAQRRLEEERLSKERDEKSQKKILELSNEIEAKATAIRQKKIDSLNCLQFIEVIEGEKQILSSNEVSICNNISEYNSEQDYACSKELKERESQKPRMSEVNADGTLNDTGKRILDSDLEAIRIKYNRLKIENEAQLMQSAGKAQEQLRSKIISDLNKLKNQTFKANSLLNDGIYFRVGSYDGSANIQGWNYTLSLLFDGKTVFSHKGVITYENLTGLSIPEYPKAYESNRDKKIERYTEYQDNVETYDSFFRMNVPYVQAVLSYSVKPADVKIPSRYHLSIKEIAFYNVQTGKLISTTAKASSGIYDYTPATLVNWHLERTRIKEAKHDSAVAANPWAYNSGFLSLGINGGNWGSSGGYALMYIHVPLSTWMFLNMDLGVGGGNSLFDVDTSEIKKYTKKTGDSGLSFAVGIGLDKRFHLGNFHPALYYILDGGVISRTISYEGVTVIEVKNNRTYSRYKQKKSCSKADGLVIHHLGVDIPLTKLIHIDVRYSAFKLMTEDSFNSFSCGVRLNSDWFKGFF